MDKKDGAITYSHRVRMGCGNIYFRVVITDDGFPKAVFITIGKPGQCQAAMSQALALALSVGLEEGADFRRYIKALKGIHCSEAQPGEPETRFTSCADALARILEKYPRRDD